MALRAVRFASVMLTGITLSAAFAHLMELPAKVRYEPALYVKLHQTLYKNYGRIAGSAEILGLLATCTLAWKLRKSPPGMFAPAATAAASLATAHAVFWLLISPVNSAMGNWSLNEIPPDWTRWRDQWEYSHAARAFLVLGALAALTHSALQRNPRALLEGAH